MYPWVWGLWILELPLNEVLGAFVMATGAELLDGVGKVPERISSAALPVFSEGATGAEIERFKDLRGAAYEALCKLMRDVELSPPQRLSGCFPCHRALAVVDWRDHMVQVRNPHTGGRAWVLKTNKEAYVREHGGGPATARAPLS